MLDELLYVIPAHTDRAEVKKMLEEHPEIKFVSLVGVGASEYLVQRFTGMFMLYRSIQTLSAALMVFVVCRCYALCCDEPWDGE